MLYDFFKIKINVDFIQIQFGTGGKRASSTPPSLTTEGNHEFQLKIPKHFFFDKSRFVVESSQTPDWANGNFSFDLFDLQQALL